MSELTKAEQIVEDLEERGRSPVVAGAGPQSPAMHEWRPAMIGEIRDIQRNALEAAEAYLREHGMCMKLQHLIPKDPAPAGQAAQPHDANTTPGKGA